MTAKPVGIPEDFVEWKVMKDESLWVKYIQEKYIAKGIRVFHAHNELARKAWAFYFVFPSGLIVRAPFEISQDRRFYVR